MIWWCHGNKGSQHLHLSRSNLVWSPRYRKFQCFMDAPRKILFRRFVKRRKWILFRRSRPQRESLGGIHKRRKRIFLGASIKHWNFLYRGDHTKFDLDKCKWFLLLLQQIEWWKIVIFTPKNFPNTLIGQSVKERTIYIYRDQI